MRNDLQGFGFMPGHYLCRCVDCVDLRSTGGNTNQFQGAKGSYRCETCATTAMARHKDEQRHAEQLARPGLMIAVGGTLRIVGIEVANYGQGLTIHALGPDDTAVIFDAVRRVGNQNKPMDHQRLNQQISGVLDKEFWDGRMLARCTGRHCQHGKFECTADPDYQRYMAQAV